MPEQFFDDKAFFYVVTSFTFCAIVPWTALKLSAYFSAEKVDANHDPKNPQCTCQECALNQKKIRAPKLKSSRHFTVSNILFVLLWIFFISLLIQLPDHLDEQLTVFDPYVILGLENDADASVIKKAYRKQSMQWHPDKNPDDPNAAEQFMLISKAYKALTDEKAQENMAKFGNVDGYKGTTVTLGLPSFLTEEQNALPILLLYFLLFMVAPPIGVWIWWSKAKERHSSGVLRRTYALQHKLLAVNLGSGNLIEPLALSTEFQALGRNRFDPNEAVALDKKLSSFNKIKLKFSKFKSQKWFFKTINLIYAHLHNVDIPPTLKTDYIQLLKDCPRLLKNMLEISEAKRRVPNMQVSMGMFKTSCSVIVLQQCMTQRLWLQDHPVRQLPHLTQDHVRLLLKNDSKLSLQTFQRMSQEKKERIITNLDAKQWEEVNYAAQRIPMVEVDIHAYVEDEDDIYTGDILTVRVDVFRLTPAEIQNGRERKGKPIVRAGVPSLDIDLQTLIEDLPKQQQKPKAVIDAYAFAPHFPYPKVEQWYAYLVKDNRPFTFMVPILTFTDVAEVIMKIPAGNTAGKTNFQVHIVCDSYRGIEVIETVKVQVKDKPEPEDVDENADLLQDADEDEEEEYSPFWDYVVLVLMAFGAYLWLDSKGYWQLYVMPYVEKVQVLLAPLTKKLEPFIAPVWAMVFGEEDTAGVKEEL
jgi:translocation protein SEC63